MAAQWMDAAGQQGIPSAFIVDRSGRVAWIGHPWAGMDETLEKVIAGTRDDKAVRAAAEERQRQQDARARAAALLKPIQDLHEAGKDRDAVAALDKMLAENEDLRPTTEVFRYRMVLGYDTDAA